ncbi:MAG TPA: thioredoxin domain-containing protein [Usitatibacteraceae bacterium]|nr:thioredoxin domain-containing protein [Usitatibacteraceae bacterium]
MSQPSTARRAALIAAALIVLVIAGAITFILIGPDPAKNPALASAHSPMAGDAKAPVHVVEFLDPACETCAVFYPYMKQLAAENPGRIRISLRIVPLHKGSESVAAMIEAARLQDKYWNALEALLATQDLWVDNHVVQPANAMRVLSGAGIDIAKLEADMKSPKVAENLAKDLEDAQALRVTKTPEFFVNGRQMESFGKTQLRRLVLDAVSRAPR